MRRPLASGQIKLGSFGIHYRNSKTALLGIRFSLKSNFAPSGSSHRKVLLQTFHRPQGGIFPDC